MIAAWSPMRSRARPATKRPMAMRHGVGPVEAQQLGHEALVVQVHGCGARWPARWPGRGPAPPTPAGRCGTARRPRRPSASSTSKTTPARRQQSCCSGASFTTRSARSPMRSSSARTRSTETTKRRSRRHRRLAAEEVVAALGERHVHGVDVVVGGDGRGRRASSSPVRSTRACARGSGRRAPPSARPGGAAARAPR